MALVVLIEEPEKLDAFTEQDMRRWWRNKCIKRVAHDETYFEVGEPAHINLYGGVERLKSFGIKARVARRTYKP